MFWSHRIPATLSFTTFKLIVYAKSRSQCRPSTVLPKPATWLDFRLLTKGHISGYLFCPLWSLLSLQRSILYVVHFFQQSNLIKIKERSIYSTPDNHSTFSRAAICLGRDGLYISGSCIHTSVWPSCEYLRPKVCSTNWFGSLCGWKRFVRCGAEPDNVDHRKKWVVSENKPAWTEAFPQLFRESGREISCLSLR